MPFSFYVGIQCSQQTTSSPVFLLQICYWSWCNKASLYVYIWKMIGMCSPGEFVQVNYWVEFDVECKYWRTSPHRPLNRSRHRRLSSWAPLLAKLWLTRLQGLPRPCGEPATSSLSWPGTAEALIKPSDCTCVRELYLYLFRAFLCFLVRIRKVA